MEVPHLSGGTSAAVLTPCGTGTPGEREARPLEGGRPVNEKAKAAEERWEAKWQALLRALGSPDAAPPPPQGGAPQWLKPERRRPEETVEPGFPEPFLPIRPPPGEIGVWVRVWGPDSRCQGAAAPAEEASLGRRRETQTPGRQAAPQAESALGLQQTEGSSAESESGIRGEKANGETGSLARETAPVLFPGLTTLPWTADTQPTEERGGLEDAFAAASKAAETEVNRPESPMRWEVLQEKKTGGLAPSGGLVVPKFQVSSLPEPEETAPALGWDNRRAASQGGLFGQREPKRFKNWQEEAEPEEGFPRIPGGPVGLLAAVNPPTSRSKGQEIQRCRIVPVRRNPMSQREVSVPGERGQPSTPFLTPQKMTPHPSRKAFPCPWCPLVFAYQSRLETHWRSHTGEKPYKCSECGRAFARKDALTTHGKIHGRREPLARSPCE